MPKKTPITMTLAVNALLIEEAEAIGTTVTAFLRLLVDQARGEINFTRPASAPKRRPFRLTQKQLKSGNFPKTAQQHQRLIAFSTPQRLWLEHTKHQMGGMSLSQIITFLLLRYCGTNPLDGH